ncbi:hypothetical protein D3C71_1925210 [compost metagenome]
MSAVRCLCRYCPATTLTLHEPQAPRRQEKGTGRPLASMASSSSSWLASNVLPEGDNSMMWRLCMSTSGQMEVRLLL